MDLGEQFEQARAHLECALAADTAHNPLLAIDELERALNLLGQGPPTSPKHQHARALAWWMLGNLELPFRDPPDTRLNDTWERSLEFPGSRQSPRRAAIRARLVPGPL
jgi:hypothetical protein